MTKEEFVTHCVHYMENNLNREYQHSALGKFENNLTESEEFLFKCPKCGESVAFFELEFWDGSHTIEDVLNEKVYCSCCYEDLMGDDL